MTPTGRHLALVALRAPAAQTAGIAIGKEEKTYPEIRVTLGSYVELHDHAESVSFQLETQLEYAKFQKDVWQKATSYAWKTFRDPSVRRQFKVLSVLGRAALPEDNLKEVSTTVANREDKM